MKNPAGKAQLPSPFNLSHFPVLGTFTSGLAVRRAAHCNIPNASLQNILSGYKIALSQGCYKWHHDQVLRKLAEVLEQQQQGSKGITTVDNPSHTSFIREGGEE